MVWHATLVSDTYDNPVFVKPDGTLKTRRPLPVTRARDFISSLVQTSDGRWVFSSFLNGWPALTNLELVSVTCKVRGVAGMSKIKRIWDAGDKSKAAPFFPEPKKNKNKFACRATLRAPAWTAQGWSQDSPGFVLYFLAGRSPPRVVHGEKMVDIIQQDLQKAGKPVPKVTRAHHWAHRYYKAKENPKDKITYHSGVLLEWDHGEYVTNVEMGFLNGLSGYSGRCNWYDDRDSPRTALCDGLPDATKAPWLNTKAEIRVEDLTHIQSLDGFKAYLAKYTGSRFLDPHIANSVDVRYAFRSQLDIMKLLCNYIQSPRGSVYKEQNANCQTFSADLFSLLSGKKEEPYTKIMRVLYKNNMHLFMYDKGVPIVKSDKNLLHSSSAESSSISIESL